MKTRYRIVTDDYCGYEVQHKYWWWPWWIQTDVTNTHSSVEQAEAFVRKYTNPHAGKIMKFVND